MKQIAQQVRTRNMGCSFEEDSRHFATALAIGMAGALDLNDEDKIAYFKSIPVFEMSDAAGVHAFAAKIAQNAVCLVEACMLDGQDLLVAKLYCDEDAPWLFESDLPQIKFDPALYAKGQSPVSLVFRPNGDALH